MRGIVQGMNRPVSIQNGETKDLTAYNYKADSVTFVQYQRAGAKGVGNFQKGQQKSFISACRKVGNCGRNPKNVFTGLDRNGLVSITC